MPTVDFERRVETTIDSIQASDEIHPDNKALIADFKRDLKLEGLSDGWLQKLTSHLKVIAEHLGDTRFEDMDEADVKDLVEWAQGRDVSESTVNAYKQVIKRFWRWLYDTPKGEHPEPVDWINTTRSNGSETLPQDLLTREDVDALKDAAKNPRDRAFMAVLYETGARIGELIDLTVGDIEDHDHGRKVVIDGKTGPRRLPLLESSPALNKWLNAHPSGDGDDPLWCHLNDGSKTLSYHYIRKKLLVRAKERAGVDKPITPHHWRHSRATDLANDLTEAQMCEWFGWVQGSDVPARYVHLSGRDIDDAYGALHGIEPSGQDDDGPTVVQCWRCEYVNDSGDRFCRRCGAALDESAADDKEQIDAKIKRSFAEVDPDDEETREALETLDDLIEERVNELLNDPERLREALNGD